MDIDGFFDGYPGSRQIFDCVLAAANELGPITVRVTKSQIALVHGGSFAILWMPETHLKRKAAPLVLTFSFPEPRPWPRWKEIYEVSPRRFTHHLELWTPQEVDAPVRAWLRKAWEQEQGRIHAC